MTSAVIEAGDGLALTVPALLRARATARPDAVLLVCDDDRLTYADADDRSAGWRRRCSRSARAREPASASSTRTGPSSSSPGSPPPESARSACRSARSRRAPNWSAPAASADVGVLLSASSYRSHDYPATLRSRSPNSISHAPPPLVRRVVARRSGASRSPAPMTTRASVSRGRRRSSSRTGRRIDDEVLRAAEDAVTPADPMVIVHTSGSTSAPKGVIHAHGPLIRHLDNLNQLRRLRTGRDAVLELALLLDRRVRVRAAGHAGRGRDARVLERADGRRRARRASSANGRRWSTASRSRSRTYPGPELRVARSVVDPARQPVPDHAGRRAAARSRAAPRDARHDRGRKRVSRERGRGRAARAPSRLVRRVRCRDSRPRSSTDTGDAVRGPNELGELLFRGPFLMEGYYGRERHETFDADGWYYTGDLVLVDDDGYFYFKGAAAR